MKTYTPMTIEHAQHVATRTYIEMVGNIRNSGSCLNSRGNMQWYADLVDRESGKEIRISVLESEYDQCKLIEQQIDNVTVRGRVFINGTTLVYCDSIIYDSANQSVPRIPEPTARKFRLNEVEMLFLRTQQIPGEFFMLDHVQVAGKELDFVLYRKSDGKPVCAFEIDGNTHSGTRVADLARDVRIESEIGIPVNRIDAATVFSDARKLKLIE